MKKTVLTFGLISGAILSAMMLATLPFLDRIGFDRGEIIGYTSMVVAFLLIFFGVRSYRDNVAGGTRRVRPRIGRSHADLGRRLTVLCRHLGGDLLQVGAGLRHQVSGPHPRQGAKERRERGSDRPEKGGAGRFSGALSESCDQCGDHLPGAAARGADRLAGVGWSVEPPEESGLRAACIGDGSSGLDVCAACERGAGCDESRSKP